MVGIGVDDVLDEGEGGAAGGGDKAGGIPVEGGGDLQCDAGERLAAGVAQGELGAHGEMAGGGHETGVEIVGGEEEAGALLIGENGAGGSLVWNHGFRPWRGVVVWRGWWSTVTLEEDLTLRGCWRRWAGGGLSSRGHTREEKGEREAHCFFELQGVEAPVMQ